MTGDVVATTAEEWDRSEMVKHPFFYCPSLIQHPSIPLPIGKQTLASSPLLHRSSSPSSSSRLASSSAVSRMKTAPDTALVAENRKERRLEDREPAGMFGTEFGGNVNLTQSGKTLRKAGVRKEGETNC